jgi:hypothetical protein
MSLCIAQAAQPVEIVQAQTEIRELTVKIRRRP